MRPEIQRRLVHASGIALPLGYVSELLTWGQVGMLFILMTLLALTLETLRLSGFIDWAIFETLTREYERDHLAGYALYMFGASIAALAFRPRVALPAILMLMIADPMSGLLGSSSSNGDGSSDNNDASDPSTVKPAHVLFSMFGICTLIALPFVHPVPAVCGAIAATAADGAKPVIAGYIIDDNLTIPPAAALAIVGGQHLVGYLPTLG